MVLSCYNLKLSQLTPVFLTNPKTILCNDVYIINYFNHREPKPMANDLQSHYHYHLFEISLGIFSSKLNRRQHFTSNMELLAST